MLAIRLYMWSCLANSRSESGRFSAIFRTVLLLTREMYDGFMPQMRLRHFALSAFAYSIALTGYVSDSRLYCSSDPRKKFLFLYIFHASSTFACRSFMLTYETYDEPNSSLKHRGMTAEEDRSHGRIWFASIHSFRELPFLRGLGFSTVGGDFNFVFAMVRFFRRHASQMHGVQCTRTYTQTWTHTRFCLCLCFCLSNVQQGF